MLCVVLLWLIPTALVGERILNFGFTGSDKGVLSVICLNNMVVLEHGITELRRLRVMIPNESNLSPDIHWFPYLVGHREGFSVFRLKVIVFQFRLFRAVTVPLIQIARRCAVMKIGILKPLST